MSTKNPIDELFRRQLSEKGITYSAEHWEHMESLIGSQKKKTSKRLLWSALALFLLFAGYFLVQDTATEQSSITQENASQINPPEQNTVSIHTPPGNAKMPSTIAESSSDAKSEVQDAKETSEVHAQHEPAAGITNPGTIIPSDAKHVLNEFKSEAATNTSSPAIKEGPSLKKHQNTAVPSTLFRRDKIHLSALQNAPERAFNADQIAVLGKNTNALSRPLDKEWKHPRFTSYFLNPYLEYGKIRHRNLPELEQWKSDKEKTQAYQYYGVTFGVNRGRFSLQLGIGQMQWSELTNYPISEEHYVFDTSYRMVNPKFIQRPDGSYAALIKIELDTVSRSTSRSVVCSDCEVKFRYTTIPLIASYTLGSNKWKLSLNPGINLAILSAYHGNYSVQFHTESGTVSDVNLAELSNTYLNKVMVQAEFGVGIKYRASMRLWLNADFNYRRSLGSMTRSYQQNPEFYGLRLGLQYSLN